MIIYCSIYLFKRLALCYITAYYYDRSFFIPSLKQIILNNFNRYIQFIHIYKGKRKFTLRNKPVKLSTLLTYEHPLRWSLWSDLILFHSFLKHTKQTVLLQGFSIHRIFAHVSEWRGHFVRMGAGLCSTSRICEYFDCFFTPEGHTYIVRGIHSLKSKVLVTTRDTRFMFLS